MSKVWFITGTSTGIGKALAEKAAAIGDKVFSTARTLSSIQYLAEEYPQQVCVHRLDVCNESDRQSAIQATLDTFGRIDVLVNNAGYGLVGMAEETDMRLIREQMETNFFGLVGLTQLVLPIMRAQQSGYIINVASMAGLRGFAGAAYYCASKFAVVGFSEALAQELEQFGIRVSVVEPGPYRTDWAGRSMVKTQGFIEPETPSPYQVLNQKIGNWFKERDGKQPGDPAQIAEVLISAAEKTKPPLHLLLGDPAIEAWEQQLKNFQDPNYFLAVPHDRYEI